MLKQRIITAAILIPLFIFLLFTLSMRNFSLLTGLIVGWAATEWSLLMGIKKFWHRLIFPFMTVIGMMTMFFFPASFYFLYVALVWWIAAFILILCYPRLSHYWGKSIIIRGLMGLLVLLPCWLALNYMRYAENGIYIVFYLFILIWGADIGAYFVGKQWGKHKILPEVSPGKSWEGLCGALMTTVILVSLIAFWHPIPYLSLPAALLVSVITILFSIVGDLFESMLKRNTGQKDSSHLLPGHGGILDRVDSLTAGAPLFVLGLIWMNKLYFAVN